MKFIIFALLVFVASPNLTSVDADPIQEAATEVQDIGNQLIEQIQTIFGGALKPIFNLVNGLSPLFNVVKVIPDALTLVAQIYTQLLTAVQGLLNTVVTLAQDTLNKIIDAIKDQVLGAIDQLVKAILGTDVSLIGEVREAVGTLQTLVNKFVYSLESTLTTSLEAIKAVPLQNTFINAITQLTKLLSNPLTILANVGGVVTSLLEAVATVVQYIATVTASLLAVTTTTLVDVATLAGGIVSIATKLLAATVATSIV